MREGGYTYEASLFEPGLWIVRRTKLGEITFQDEAQVLVDTLEPEVAIRAAIEQGSWA